MMISNLYKPFLKIFTFFLIIFLNSSCAGYRPLVLHNQTVYVGMFKLKETVSDQPVKFYSLNGGGLAFGATHLGLGYFSKQSTIVLAGGDYHFKTPMVELFSGKNAEEMAKHILVFSGDKR